MSKRRRTKVRRVRNSTRNRISRKRISKKRIIRAHTDKYYSIKKDLDLHNLSVPDNLKLSLENILEHINTESFIQEFMNSEKTLLTIKRARYEEILQIYNNLVYALNREMEYYRGMGIDFEDDDPKNLLVKAHYARIYKIESMINLIDQKLHKPQTIANKRRDLLDSIYNPIRGILTISGEAREWIRRELYTDMYIFARLPKIYCCDSFLNVMITGQTGIGKTQLAAVLSHFYYKIGLVLTNRYERVSKSQLVAGHKGQTALKTIEKLNEVAIEGVLFIDEAYSLLGCSDKGVMEDEQGDSYGREAIDEMVNFTDYFKGLGIIIVAGYKNAMRQCFMKANPGLKRRFTKVYHLKALNPNDLADIFQKIIFKKTTSDFLSDSQMRSIKNLIVTYSKYKNGILFEHQAADMETLSNVIIKDATIVGSDKYTEPYIKNSFNRFFIENDKY